MLTGTLIIDSVFVIATEASIERSTMLPPAKWYGQEQVEVEEFRKEPTGTKRCSTVQITHLEDLRRYRRRITLPRGLFFPSGTQKLAFFLANTAELRLHTSISVLTFETIVVTIQSNVAF